MSIFSRFRKATHSYNPLPESENEDDEKDSSTDTLNPPETTKATPAAFYPTLLCVLFALTNIIVLRIYEFNSTPLLDTSPLRRPTQFRGLDKIERLIPPIERSILNFPFLVGLIDQNSPRRVFADDAESRVAWKGVDLPEARKVNITKTVSTVLHARSIGAWSLVYSLSIFPQDSFSNSSLTLGHQLNLVDVYVLPPSLIDSQKLSYRTRPNLEDKLATVVVDYGVQWTYRFPCAMDSLHAFILVAASESTQVEWWQDKQSVTPAVYITQHATK